MDLVGVPHRLGKGTSASRTLAPKEVDCESPTLVEEENETPFYKGVETFPSKYVLKP